MQRDELAYKLPPELVAQTPIEPRDSARLLVDRGSAAPGHRLVRDLPDLLQPGDLLVVNDSRVIPARLHLRRRTGGAVEVLLLEPRDGARRCWEALVRPGGKLQRGEVLYGPDTDTAVGTGTGAGTAAGIGADTDIGGAVARMGERTDAGDTFLVELLADDALDLLGRHGEMPLPPYITTPLERPERYQTVYAAEPGSAAAPTAGLHFTLELLECLAAAGIESAPVELVVGLDTFAPITAEDPLEHRIHTERYRVPAETLARCQQARRVVAIGTTAVRALESAAATGNLVGRTDLYIHRGYQWSVVDLMMTNFHMPYTTLLMMIDAFVGDRWRRLYDVAVAERYRFLSFGDAMLLDRTAN